MDFCSIFLYSSWFGSIDSYDLYRVSWFTFVYQIIIDHKINIYGCLSFGNLIWSFLKFNILFICISWEIINNLKGMSAAASITFIRLIDSASFQGPQLTLFTARSRASEVYFFWLGNNLRASNKDSFETNQVVNLIWRKMSHLVGIFKVNNSDSYYFIKVISFLDI